MTSIDFLNKVHKSLDSQEYNLSYSPAKSKNYMLYCNGNFIGGLFDEELCFVYVDSVSELLGHPEPVYRGYSSTAQHRMLVIPEEHWAKALKLLYAEKFDWSRLVYDISKALAKVLDPADEIQPAATEEQIADQESVLDFTLPSQVREFFLLTAGIQASTGVILTLSGMFDLTIHGERYCVLGEFWKEADGDQLLLRPGGETIWYYAHEQDKVKRLCNDMTELLEKKLARYLNEY